jgi:hypothetical protein
MRCAIWPVIDVERLAVRLFSIRISKHKAAILRQIRNLEFFFSMRGLCLSLCLVI